MKKISGPARPAGVCPVLWFNFLVGGKYKLWIVYELRDGPRRYGALRRGLVDSTMEKAVTARTLSRELKELTALGLVQRKQLPGVTLRVQYKLTARGRRLIPVIDSMVLWTFDRPVPAVPSPMRRPRQAA